MNPPPLNSVIVWRCSDGLCLRQPDSPSFEVIDGSKCCKSLKISPSGRYIAWCNDKLVSVYDVTSGSTRLALNRPDTILIDISPKDSILLLWESCSPGTQNEDNMRLFYLADDSRCGDIAGTFMHKRISHWFLQWSNDEKVAVRMAASGEILFYENNDFSKAVRRLGELGKISDFSLGPGSLAPLAVFSAGKQAQPSTIRLFSYPHSLNASGARLSLFRCDSVNFHWNATGTCVLLVVTSEQSDRSYYGDRSLYFALSPSGNAASRGDSDASNCCLVPLFGASRSSKSGTGGGNESQQVHYCCWHPDASIFCAVYGPFPARTAIFRVLPQKPGADALSCLQRIADLEPASRNWAQFSKPDGRFLATGGFGSVRGDLQLWSVADPTQPRLLFSKQIPDANTVEWSADGQHLLVGTLAPRLRVNNLFAVASLVRASDSSVAGISLRIAFEWLPSTPDGQLWEVSMIKSNRVVAQRPSVTTPATGQAKQNPLIAALESPSGVCINGSGRPLSSQKPPDVYIPPHLRNKQAGARGAATPNQSQSKPASDAEALQKRIKGVRKKLDEIDRLKERMTAANQLELNQMKKVESEASLRAELSQLLSLSAN